MRQKEAGYSAFGAWGLIIAAWLASIAPLPWFFYALAGYSMSSGHGHASFAEVAALGAGPIAALAALLVALFWYHRSGKRIAAMFIPSLLVLEELAFILVVWVGK